MNRKYFMSFLAIFIVCCLTTSAYALNYCENGTTMPRYLYKMNLTIILPTLKMPSMPGIMPVLSIEKSL